MTVNVTLKADVTSTEIGAHAAFATLPTAGVTVRVLAVAVGGANVQPDTCDPTRLNVVKSTSPDPHASAYCVNVIPDIVWTAFTPPVPAVKPQIAVDDDK